MQFPAPFSYPVYRIPINQTFSDIKLEDNSGDTEWTQVKTYRDFQESSMKKLSYYQITV